VPVRPPAPAKVGAGPVLLLLGFGLLLGVKLARKR